MSKNAMTYKGYTGVVEYDHDDGCFVGRVVGIQDVIGFHGTSVEELERDFRETLDFYIESCAKRGKSPDRPYSGKLNLRLPPETHRRLAVEAEAAGKSINDVILEAIDDTYAPSGGAVAVAVKPKVKKAKR